MNRHSPQHPARRSSEAGLTLIETTIALLVLFVATAGLMNVGVVAVMTTENQGHLAARTTEYAQDKIEQLMSLKYADPTSDTISPNCLQYLVVAACTAGGAGLSAGGAAVGTAQTAGSTNFAVAAVNLYVDYLDVSGTPLGGKNDPHDTWYYQRRWSIAENAAHTMKTVTVVCRVRTAVGNLRSRIIADATLVTMKSSPF